MTVRATAANRTQRKTARTMSLHCICIVGKIAVRDQKLRFARASARIPFLNSTAQTMLVHN